MYSNFITMSVVNRAPIWACMVFILTAQHGGFVSHVLFYLFIQVTYKSFHLLFLTRWVEHAIFWLLSSGLDSGPQCSCHWRGDHRSWKDCKEISSWKQRTHCSCADGEQTGQFKCSNGWYCNHIWGIQTSDYCYESKKIASKNI